MNSGRKKRGRRGTYRILLVDDHPIVRDGLKDVIDREPDLKVCGEAGDYSEALDAVDQTQPDLVVMDITLGGANGIELTRRLHHIAKNVKVVVLSVHDESLYAERALKAGAQGYVMKQDAPDAIIAAIRMVLRGGLYVSESLASQLLRKVLEGDSFKDDEFGLKMLTDRELEIFELMGRGCSAADIAEKLHLSGKTVETHRSHIKQKLKLKNSSEVRRRAVSWVSSQPG